MNLKPLLIRSKYNYIPKHKNTDFQMQMYSIGVHPSVNNIHIPCVVIFTSSDDHEVSELSLNLAKKDIRLFRINSDDFKPSTIEYVTPSNEIVIGNEYLYPKLYWKRSFWLKSHINSEVITYMETQMEAFSNLLFEISDVAVNRQVSKTNCLSQLNIAKASGLNIPRTIITKKIQISINNMIPESWGTELVIKPIGSHWTQYPKGRLKGTFPVVMSRRQLKKNEDEPVPIMIQEFIPHMHEIRVYMIDKQIIAYRVGGRNAAEELWTTTEKIYVEPFTLPIRIVKSLQLFKTRMKFDIGAVDLLIDNNFNYVFLEVNLSGDWHYYEKKSEDKRVSNAVQDFIARNVKNDD